MEKTKGVLKNYNQEHLLDFYNKLNNEEKASLKKQIKSIDFQLIDNLFKKNNNIIKQQKEFKSMTSHETTDEYFDLGLQSIFRKEFALVTMAGGQGTRLGHNGPKGTYILGYGINKSLFELQCDKLKNIYKKTNIYIPWFIMTSIENNDLTIKFFEKNDYFNYPKEKITFFMQDQLPMLDINGKIIMSSKSNMKMGANGSGGVFSSLAKSNILKKMLSDNIKWIFIGGIDNILLPVDNPDLIGFAIKNNYKIVSKTITKKDPNEKVGVFGYLDDKPGVIEYIFMSDEMNNLKDEKNNLIYKDIHTLSNLFHISILEEAAKKELNYYPALKKTEYLNKNGDLIIPEIENAYKYETFIFDIFSYVDKIGLLKGKREEIFAPVKNKEGVDSPETAANLYNKIIK
ncbi:MAG: UTP--glucose-1-phosphate uridylyltransferase [Bacilli bacterium]|nr:UTP--glucose-1-phosphate uridylyltransferase [Bacilli bacterium]